MPKQKITLDKLARMMGKGFARVDKRLDYQGKEILRIDKKIDNLKIELKSDISNLHSAVDAYAKKADAYCIYRCSGAATLPTNLPRYPAAGGVRFIFRKW